MHRSTRTRTGLFTGIVGVISLALALVAPGVGADTDADEAPGRSGDTAAAEHRQDGRADGTGDDGSEVRGESDEVRKDGDAKDGEHGASSEVRKDGDAEAQGQPDDPGAHGQDRAAEAQQNGNGPETDNGPDNGNGNDNGAANNRGTVKIKTPGEDAFPPANRPHPGCDFEVHVYNASSGSATLTFSLHAPTAGGSVTASIEGLEVAESGDGLVHSGFEAFNLNDLFGDELEGIEPQAQQGYHVKLTLEWDRDTPPANVKHKVFWLDCPAEVDDEIIENGNGNGNGNGPNGNGEVDNGVVEIQPEVLPEVITAPAPEAQPEVAPQVQLPEAAPEHLAITPAEPEVAPQVLGVEERRQLPVTGGDASVLMVLAGLLLLAGGTLLTTESQLHARRRPARSRI